MSSDEFRRNERVVPSRKSPSGVAPHGLIEQAQIFRYPMLWEASVTVDGRDRRAVRIDTDPFVYAVGFRVDEHVVCTSVLPRESLPFLDLALTTYE